MHATLVARTLALAGVIVPLLRVSAQGVPLPNQGPAAPRIPRSPASTPPSGTTTGYWQQRADYRIVAHLDESRGVVQARGTLRYTNASPDTLRELWLHQHLNAFRPGSRWSENDEAQGRERFQRLADPDFGYERFLSAPRVQGQALRYSYPLASDSTVVRVELLRPLAPGAQVEMALEWEARPSTVLRRQGRRGRHFDFAQWYPKVAVYDRHGWKPNALVAQGELYGEFGTFDVSFVLPSDQTIAATGVPVSGDPGWERARVPGSAAPHYARAAYGGGGSTPSGDVRVPKGYRAVRFVARDVHHFGWSVSPDYRYEGSRWIRPRNGRPGWDTVAVHVLHEHWTPGRTLSDARHALGWLESIFGPYAWPQLTIAERLEGSGTEFPMLVMNGEEDRSLVVHEVGHQFTYGMLANNEWQSAWMDEGFTTYQEMWSRGEVRVPVAMERAAKQWHDVVSIPDTAIRRRIGIVEAFSTVLDVSAGFPGAPAAGLRSDLFSSKDVYDAVVYDRAALIYSALHDVMGDERFRVFVRTYFGRWTFRHVDRWAMQRTAESVTGTRLGWFFDQWIDSNGTIDYALEQPTVSRVGPDSTGVGPRQWVVTVQLQRRGVYRHPMPVGVKTASGWTVVRADPLPDRQAVRIIVTEPPTDVWLDPFGSVESRTSASSRFVLP